MRVTRLAWLLAGCGSSGNAVGALEIGWCEVDGHFEWGNAERCSEGGVFRAFDDGDTAVVITGANALNMVVPSLRARDIDPRAPDPSVSITIDGRLMASDIEGTRADMQAAGDGFVLWNLRVPFTSELCCYTCRQVLIEASLMDASGKRFRGSVQPVTQFRQCPSPCDCCVSADSCPDTSLTQVCPGGQYPEECLPPLPSNDAGADGGNGESGAQDGG